MKIMKIIIVVKFSYSIQPAERLALFVSASCLQPVSSMTKFHCDSSERSDRHKPIVNFPARGETDLQLQVHVAVSIRILSFISQSLKQEHLSCTKPGQKNGRSSGRVGSFVIAVKSIVSKPGEVEVNPNVAAV